MNAFWATSLPAAVMLLFVLAVAERLFAWVTGLGVLPWLRKRSGRSLSSVGYDGFTTVLHGTKRVELEHRQTESMLRDEEEAGAPPAADLYRNNTVVIRLPDRPDGPAPDPSR